MDTRQIESVLDKYAGWLMSLDGVVGSAIGLCDGKPCIRVFVNQDGQLKRGNIPETLEGYTVLVEEKGRFRALK